MMTIIVKIGIFFMNIIFAIMKLLPIQKKITYISRQMDTTPVDFSLTIQQMRKDHPEYRHVVLAKMIHPGLKAKIGYVGHMFVQMYHIATSEAVILDTYCICISILHQRKSLVVIQMWHALGAFKKFAYSILDCQEGSSSKVAKLMHMHENYTYVLSSSPYAAKFFAEAFHVREDQMRIYPLPKTDLLVDEERKASIIKQIDKAYPELNDGKKIIVYAPTFRKTHNHLKEGIEALIKEVDFEKYHFVLKLHPLSSMTIDDDRIIIDHQFSSLEFFHKADIIITDYSAVLFEASLLHKPIYFYDFDYDFYKIGRSFYIDYEHDMPGYISRDPKDLMHAIDAHSYDYKKLQDFSRLMISPCHISYTKDFTDFLYHTLNKEAL